MPRGRMDFNLERELLAAGFTVVGTAYNADDAVRVAGHERPDVVLMDIRLRGTRAARSGSRDLGASGSRCRILSGTIDAAQRRAAPAEPRVCPQNCSSLDRSALLKRSSREALRWHSGPGPTEIISTETALSLPPDFHGRQHR